MSRATVHAKYGSMPGLNRWKGLRKTIKQRRSDWLLAKSGVQQSPKSKRIPPVALRQLGQGATGHVDRMFFSMAIGYDKADATEGSMRAIECKFDKTELVALRLIFMSVAREAYHAAQLKKRGPAAAAAIAIGIENEATELAAGRGKKRPVGRIQTERLCQRLKRTMSASNGTSAVEPDVGLLRQTR